MISVLCPSRGRPFSCWQALASLQAHAKSDLELLVRVDDDDPLLSGYTVDLDRAIDGGRLNVSIGPAHGYTGLHHYVNELAAAATGDYLLLWNDDARMHTAGWDTLVERWLPGSVPWVGSLTPLATEGNVFPIVSRAFYDAVGHFSLSPHNDTWVERVALEAGCHHDLSHLLRVEHLHQEMDDDTRAGVLAAVGATSPAFYSDEMQQLRAADVARIRAAA